MTEDTFFNIMKEYTERQRALYGFRAHKMTAQELIDSVE